MITQREPLMVNLFNLVAQSGAYVTKDRKIRLWSELQPEQLPAIFMFEKKEMYEQGKRAMPAMTTLNVELYIYAWCNNAASPASILNPLLDGVDATLRTGMNQVTGQQTLGGLVYHAWIEGEIIKDTSGIDGYTMAVVPLSILVP